MSESNKLSQLRRDYTKASFNKNNADPDPVEQFRLWFNDAVECQMLEPNAMVLSTASKDGKPSSRVLLLKNFDKSGFVFYSNYESHKARELEENPFGSLLFYWDKLERQVRIEGSISKISFEESNEYFQTRPITSRLGAWASKQSSPLSSRFSLMKDVALLMAKFQNNVPLPPYWGGYRLVPSYFEFWQGRESRLHDRIRYALVDGSWDICRLYP